MRGLILGLIFAAFGAWAQDTPTATLTPSATPTVTFTHTPTVTPTPTQPIDAGLLAYYRFDENSLDSSPNGQDLGYTGDAATYAVGRVGWAALVGDAGMDYFYRENIAGASGAANLSLAFWYRKTSTHSNSVVSSEYITSWVGNRIPYMTGAAADNGGNSRYAYMPQADNLGTAWHHYIVTSASSALRIYLDATQKNIDTGTPWTGQAIADTSDKFMVGVYGDGYVDEVRLYDRILSSTEMAELAEQDAPGATPTATPTATISPTITLTPTITPTPPLWPGMTPPYLDEWDAGDKYSGPRGRGPEATLTPTYNILPPGGSEF